MRLKMLYQAKKPLKSISKFVSLCILSFSIQGCFIYPWITTEDPGAELQFLNEKGEPIKDLEFHYMLGTGRYTAPGIEKYETLRTNEEGFISLPKKRKLEIMMFLPDISHTTKHHFWRWCVSSKEYLPKLGSLKISEGNKIIKETFKLSRTKNNWSCSLYPERILRAKCSSENNVDCPKFDGYYENLKNQKIDKIFDERDLDMIRSLYGDRAS